MVLIICLKTEECVAKHLHHFVKMYLNEIGDLFPVALAILVQIMMNAVIESRVYERGRGRVNDKHLLCFLVLQPHHSVT